MEVVDFFRAGGWPMFPILMLGMVALVATAVGLVVGLGGRRPRVALGFALALGVAGGLLVAIGGLTYLAGVRRVEMVLELVAPQHREQLLARGREESLNRLWLGSGAAVAPLAGAAVLLVAGLRRRPSR